MNNDFYISSCMSIPFGGFKIKTKNDVKIFAEKCMCKGGMYVLNINEETQFVFHKDKDGEISVDFRSGDLKDIFNPSIEVASTKNDSYENSVYHYIWKCRKFINAKYFKLED